jgi:hypothetical protein
MVVGLSGRAVVASIASAALGWRLETSLGVVVVEERGRRVVELACLVVGEPSGAAVGAIGEDRHAVGFAGGGRARRVAEDRAQRRGGLSMVSAAGQAAPAVCCGSAGGRLGAAGGCRGWLPGGVFVLALELAAEGGRGFPVAKRARGDAEFGGDSLRSHSLVEQLRRLRLFARSLLSAAPLVGELLQRPRPHPPAAAGRGRVLLGGGLGGGAGAGLGVGGSLERGGPAERLAHIGEREPIPAAADTPPKPH